MTDAFTGEALRLYESTRHIVGQEKARRQIAVLMTRQQLVAQGALPQATGAIVSGRTGTGKTMLCRAVCKLSGLPYAEVNATQYTDKGYVGRDLSQAFLPLLESAAHLIDYQHAEAPFHTVPRGDSVLKRRDLPEVVQLAQRGVLLLDEFDKWMLQTDDQSGRNVGKKLQAELLKMVEGDVEYVTDSEEELGIPFDTTRVLIICAGAFVGLPALALRRLHREEEYTQDEGFWDLIEPGDFVRYGVLPELAGRLSTYIWLRPLRDEHLASIMAQPGGVAEEYRTRFESVGCKWAVSPEGLRYLAYVALSRETGARGVEHVMWGAFSEALFEAAAAEVQARVCFEPNAHRAWLEAA